jgi:hypothetical protein
MLLGGIGFGRWNLWHRQTVRDNRSEPLREYRLKAPLILVIALTLCPNSVAQDRSMSGPELAPTAAHVYLPQTQEGDDAQEKTAQSKKKESRGAIIVAPIPVSSPAIGSGIIFAGGYISPYERPTQYLLHPRLVGLSWQPTMAVGARCCSENFS